MNLFFKSYRIYLIFFPLIACVSSINCGFAQEYNLRTRPWIQEINLPSQYSEIPNETFYRDSQGSMFIGKNNGLSIIIGEHVHHIHMNGPVHVTGDGSDTLYYVSEDDLGFLIKEKGPSYHAVSRKHLLPTLHRNFTTTGIQNKSGSIIIYTDIGLFLFSKSEIIFLDEQESLNVQIPADSIRNKELLALVEDKIGIPAKGIKQIFNWNNTEIWILGAYTLHLLHDPSPLKLIETGSVQTGRILKSMVWKGQVFLGTSQGIFTISEDPLNQGHWSISNLLPESPHSIHMFSAINGQVFAAGSDGLYLVSGNHAELIETGSFTGIQAVRKGFLIASGEEGTIGYKLGKKGWAKSSIDPSIQNAHSFINFRNNIFFLCNNGVFRSNKKGDRINPIPFHSEGLLYKLIQVEQDLILVSNQQVYRYDVSEEIFQPLPSNQRSSLLSESDMILPANDGKFWILQNGDRYLSRVLYANTLDEAASTFTAYPVLSHLGEVIDMAFADSILYLTGKDKISLFDLGCLKAEPERISINQLDTEPADHALRFHFSGLELQQLPEPLFRYRIRPGSSSWSGWSSRRDHVVSGLKHGEYSMEVQAMDLYGKIADAEPLSFSVATPFFGRWYAYVFYSIFLLAILFLLRKWRLLGYQRAESRIAERMEVKIQTLAAEKERSDQLVAEVLPEETANQLRNKGKAKWDKYERATVLFSDIQGFTKIAEEMNPEKLIDELDQFFFHFDSVVEKYNIEKIKTIGDAYMAAGGIPDKNSTNPVEVVLAALEMQAYMQQLKSSKAEIWDLRIGIHTGPVIAGVVGHKKISYDIWGDTVNTASRMESSGTPGKINISGITYGMVKDYFICEYRGKLPVKYKGNIDMYYVNGLRPELSVDLKGIPNKRFFNKLQLLRLGDLEEKVFEGILDKLPETLHFHGLEYARKVYNQSFLLCRSEEIEQEDRLLVRTAALMLYTGYTQDYHNFQNRSAVISREILPDYKYSDRQIDLICNLILATKRPYNPNNRLEKILIDAKMEFIGRPDYSEQIKLLFRELKENGSKINGQQFKKQQLEVLFDFQFYTLAAQRMREVSGSDQMTSLEEERWI